MKTSRFLRNGALALALLSAGVYHLLRPHPLRAQPSVQPANTYDESLDIIAELAGNAEDRLHARCHPQLLTHGAQVAKAIGFIHGYTNCPYQFRQFAPLFFERGYNVYCARLPRHGLHDRLTPLHGALRASELVQTTSRTVDLLSGLGREVTLFGFSLGGVLAAWAAQQRPEIEHVVLVSPALAVKGIRLPLRQLYANSLTLLPNVYQWWNPVLKEQRVAPLHAYPRWSTRAVGAMLRLGGIVEMLSQTEKPCVRRATIIINPSDETVDNRAVYALAERWRTHGVAVNFFEFPSAWNLSHDLMDPDQPTQQIDRVYPQLMEWIEG